MWRFAVIDGVVHTTKTAMRRTRLACLSAAALSSACVAGGHNSEWCVDWDPNGVNDCDPPPSPPGPPPPPDRSPCEQLGDQIGQPLADATTLLGAWLETGDGDGDTDGGWSPANRPLMYWGDFFPAGWRWSGGAPATGQAALLASVTDEAGVDLLSIEELPSSLGWRWIQLDGPANALVHDQVPITIQQDDGSVLLYWYASSIDDPIWWDLVGDVKARGWVSDQTSALAGPGSGHLETTWDGGKAFLPARGVCCLPTDNECLLVIDEGADETGADDPAPVEEVEPFDPCTLIPSPFPLVAYVPLQAYSPAWRGNPTAEASIPPFGWINNKPTSGASATLESPDDTEEIYISQPGGDGPHAYAWIELGPEAAPQDPDSGVVVGDFLTHDVISLGAEVVELDDGGLLLYVANSPGAGVDWSIAGFHRPVRGWVRDGAHVTAGITDQFVLTTASYPDGSERSFMPSAGWCDVVVQGFGPLGPDDTGGSSSDGGAVLDGTSG